MTTENDFDVSALDSVIDEALASGELDATPQEDEIAPQDTPQDTPQEEAEEAVAEDKAPTDEEIAREKGWKPKEEFEGDDWVDAKEFNKRGELFTKISSQSKAIKDLNQKIDALVNHNKNVEAKAMQRALDKLEAERREAITFGDVDAFDKAEAQLKELNEQKVLTQPEKPATVEIPDYVQQFANTNPWFEKDQEMTNEMLLQTQTLVNSGKDLKTAIAEANEKIKRMFSDKFVNEKKQAAAPVMRNQPADVKKKGPSMSDLDDDQRAVWNVLKHHMTKEEFLSQLEG